jgi:hypothetical protein
LESYKVRKLGGWEVGKVENMIPSFRKFHSKLLILPLPTLFIQRFRKNEKLGLEYQSISNPNFT